MKTRKGRILTAVLAGCAMLTMTACGGKTTPSSEPPQDEAPAVSSAAPSAAAPAPQEDGNPDTWIADRTIVVQAYIDDIGYALPKDINSTPVMKELTARTGIKLDIQYTPGEKDLNVMTAQLASGTIPDVIISYLNNSSRPEFNILYKAAKEGLFADISPFFADSRVYKKYLEEGYLPNDTKKNIMFREDFGGACYMAHLAIPKVDKSVTFEPDEDYIGGMYIQKSIAEALDIDPRTIRTQDQLYDLLVRIRDGGFTDLNGNPVYPLGPKYWGGSSDSLVHVCREYWWGGDNGFFNMTADGEIKHEAETEYAMKTVGYMRKLLAEGLINPEFFTMDSTRAGEACRSHNSAIIGDVHNFTDFIIQEGDQWLPVGPLNYYYGDNSTIVSGKTGYCVWAISSKAENPEEIFRFFDYISTYEGQLLAEYGLEGEHYDMVDGYPVLKEEIRALIEGEGNEALIEIGANFGGRGFYFFDIALTDKDFKADFGEAWPGAGGGSSAYEKPLKIAEYSPRTYRLVEGLPADAYLSHEAMLDVQAQMNLLDYRETLVQAIYAGSEAEAEKIIGSFVEQMEAAGLEEFRAYLKQIYDSDNKAIKFY